MKTRLDTGEVTTLSFLTLGPIRSWRCVMSDSAWTLKDCWERAEFTREVGTSSPIVCLEDREQLLALVDRIRPYADHKWGCAVSRDLRAKSPVRANCDCGFAELMRELEGAG